ncbi:MAG: hypothetical protein O2981_07540 [Proteobacteria bacterium]|nr:hypothetical protein [Pseudomonadota bacterium]
MANGAHKIRYITGRGGHVDRGLSAYLAKLTGDYAALAVDTGLLNLSIDEQLGVVKVHAKSAAGGSLIVNSYGGYLLLLSLIDADWAPERVLMLSPLLGRSMISEKMLSSRPPRERLLRAALAERRVVRPKYLQIVTGGADPICCPDLATSVAEILQADEIEVLAGQGHQLDVQDVELPLRRFIGP